jgi:small GTP-binding protein
MGGMVNLSTVEDERNIVGKLVLLGESAVGKTSLRKRFMGRGFHASHLMTMGVDFAQKKLKLEQMNKSELELQIWDIAGQDSFKLIRARFLQKADAAFLIFDVTRENTFYQLKKWTEELVRINTTRQIPILLIGNKIDLQQLDDKKIEEYNIFLNKLEKAYPIISKGFIFTSAKTGENVEDAFHRISDEIYIAKKKV